MPNYEYECLNCGNRFEVFQSMTDKPLKKCPKCSKKVKRLISAGAGVIFKGSGFYATDYRKETKKEGETDTSNKPCSSCGPSPSSCSSCKK